MKNFLERAKVSQVKDDIRNVRDNKPRPRLIFPDDGRD